MTPATPPGFQSDGTRFRQECRDVVPKGCLMGSFQSRYWFGSRVRQQPSERIKHTGRIQGTITHRQGSFELVFSIVHLCKPSWRWSSIKITGGPLTSLHSAVKDLKNRRQISQRLSLNSLIVKYVNVCLSICYGFSLDLVGLWSRASDISDLFPSLWEQEPAYNIPTASRGNIIVLSLLFIPDEEWGHCCFHVI